MTVRKIDLQAIEVDDSGNLSTRIVSIGSGVSIIAISGTSATATLSNVSGSASSVTVLAANTGRKGAAFFNDSTSAAYLKFGSTASTSSFTVKLFPAQTFFIESDPIYTGIVTGIWDTATGAMRVTELT